MSVPVFEAQKKRALERLRIRGADEEVKAILEKLNNLERFFTTSSCSGRIALLCIPEIGAKREAEFIGKWHRPVETGEVQDAIFNAERDEIWLIAQSPILHVACLGLDSAKALLRIAIESGFKYSGIKAISPDGLKVVVEIMSTERMDVPLGADGEMLCPESYIEFVVSKANFMLERGKKKLKRLYHGVKELE